MELSILCDGIQKTLTITNPDIIESYKENGESVILKLLDAGVFITKSISPVIGRCGCCDKIDEFASCMEPFNNGGNSSRTGKVGELFALDAFTKRNPNIIYHDTSGTEKSGDAILDISDHQVDKIMIDYKNYDSSIPSDETSKLVRDLNTQNMKYAILVSYRSKICKRKYIDYDIIDGKLIVFIASTGMNILMLEMAIQYLLKLCECNILSTSQQISELVTKGTTKTISDIYEIIFMINRKHAQHVNSIKENLDKSTKLYHGMIANAESTRIEINLLLDKIDTEMKDIHRESIINRHSFTELNDIVDKVIDKEKDKHFAKRLLTLTNDLTIGGYYSETDNCIHFGDIGKLHISKSKVTMIFYNRSDEVSSYNRKYESIKNDNFYIQLSDELKKWEIIQMRLTQ